METYCHVGIDSRFLHCTKKKRQLGFLSLHTPDRFSGNLREVYYVTRDDCDFYPVWLAQNSLLANQLQNSGINVTTSRIDFYWNLLRSEAILVDSLDVIFALGRFKIVQLWHGVGYKKIILTNTRSNFGRFKKKLRNLSLKKQVFVIAGSDQDASLIKQSFNSNSVEIAGLPRNDIFSHALPRRYSDEGIVNARILYAPTFRDSKWFSPLTKDFLFRLDCFLGARNSTLIIKDHPCGKLSPDISELSNISLYTNNEKDIQELLLDTDVLITDYSSIATDFSQLKRPLIFYTPDFSDYIESSRDFYHDFKAIVPGPLIESQEEIIELLSNFCWFNNPEYQLKHDVYSKFFHKYKDGKSSQRVLLALKAYLL